MLEAHIVSGLAAIAAGGVVLFLRKGTPLHRLLGRTYAGSMVVLLVSSFGITSVTENLSGFHIISVLSACLLAFGIALPRLLRRRIPSWPLWHLRVMSTSYLLLVLTMVGQYLHVLPLEAPFNVIVFLQLPAMAGFVLIARAGRALEGRGPRTSTVD